jgi:hypothetical protein
MIKRYGFFGWQRFKRMITRKSITKDYVRSYINRIFQRNGYEFYTEPYKLNIFGVRLVVNTDSFDDIICVVYFDSEKKMQIEIFNAATEPGFKYMKTPLNAKGAAILVPGQYINVYKKGPHGKSRYTALRQSKSVKVYRDNDKDVIHDLKAPIDEGIFYINLHRAEKYNVRTYIGPYSAGCQVIQDYADFKKFMSIIDLSEEQGNKSFTYTLFTKDEFTDYGSTI